MPTDPPALMGSAEVCARLSINRSTLWRWVQATPPKITPLPTGGKAYVFKREDVEALAAQRIAA